MRVGSLVELVNDNWPYWCFDLHPVLPVKNKVYTIRDIKPDTGIYLEEIISKPHPYFKKEQGFHEKRFRELMPPTSIDIEAILEKECV